MATPAADKAEAAVQRVVRFVNAFPGVTSTQWVKADAIHAALAPLRPLAAKIAGMSIGDKKGSLEAPEIVTRLLRLSPLYVIAEAYEGGPAAPATAYLSGSPTITASDLTTAKFMLAVIDEAMPQLKQGWVDPIFYATIKQQAHRLLMIGTDLDLDTTAADQVALLWQSFKDVIKDYKAAITGGVKAGMSLLEVIAVAAGITAGVLVVKTVVGR